MSPPRFHLNDNPFDNSLPPSDMPEPSSDDEDGEDSESELGTELVTPTQSTAATSTVDDLLPPLSDFSVIWSSPIVGKTKEERKAKRRSKGQKKRAQTLTAKAIAREQTAQEIAGNEQAKKHQVLEAIFTDLRQKGITLREVMQFAFDPSRKQGSLRWETFFSSPGAAREILDFWTSPQNSFTARKEVESWAFDYTEKAIRSEARSITSSGFLQTRGAGGLTGAALTSFSFDKFSEHFRSVASVGLRMFQAFATSPKHFRDMRPQRAIKKLAVVTSAMLQVLGEYSYRNNLTKKIFGLYFYATGLQRQPISVMSHLGMTESYSAIIAKPRKLKEGKLANSETATMELPVRVGKPGSLRGLSLFMRGMARAIASTGLYGGVYDNINMVFHPAEQIIGRTDAQENGTCMTIWKLWKASIEDMSLRDFQESFDRALPLAITDIIHTPLESATFRSCLAYCALRIIVTHGGDGFARFREDLEKNQPRTDRKIEPHKTDLHPLPTVNIDESTITGNAEVVEAMMSELDVRDDPEFSQRVKIIAGDQLSIARLRALSIIRAGHEGGFQGYAWGAWMPGLFHAKMADAHGLLTTHWGKPDTGSRNPGSLWFHNTRLNRSPITLTSLPTFRICRDLIFTSLYARVLHCLLLVSGKNTLDEYISSTSSWKDLEAHAYQIVDTYTSNRKVADLRWRRQTSEKPGVEGDMVFENALLFLRDALISREFSDAVKAGDSGRVILVLKIWALSFRGNGRTKYAYEMLHIIHNLTHVWPKPLVSIILNNWLVNTTGHPNGFTEVDLVQEHMNYWIKNFYRAHGSNASWEWLETVAPCVVVLRHLSKAMNGLLGSQQGSLHAAPDLTNDIATLMKSLADHEVYKLKKGRILDDDDIPVKDTATIGLQHLTDASTNPLDEYNKAFSRLQARRRLQPIVVDEKIAQPEPVTRPTETQPPTANPALSGEIGAPSRSSIHLNSSVRDFDGKVAGDEADEASGSEFDDKELEESAFDASLEDLEPTLALADEGDVSLDMDGDVYAGVDLEGDSSDSDESGDDDDFFHEL